MKMAPTNQTRLMSAFDIKEGKMHMSFLKPTIQQPESMGDYLKTNFEVLAKDIHPIDQIELQKKMGEMVYSTLTSEAIIAHQLQNSLSNITTQLQLEKASSQAKDTRIKSLEDLVIELGNNPKDIKLAESLIKKKNEDIVALRKQLKLPPLIHPQTVEVIEKHNEEELMDLVLKLNEQLKETEQELEKYLQYKQGESTTMPQTVVPIVSTTVPSTIASALAPNVPLTTTLPITTTTSTSEATTTST